MYQLKYIILTTLGKPCAIRESWAHRELTVQCSNDVTKLMHQICLEERSVEDNILYFISDVYS